MGDTATGMFRKYKLVTGLEQQLVKESHRMPAFNPPPAVVTWGARTFVLASPPDAEELVYREGLVWSADAEEAWSVWERLDAPPRGRGPHPAALPGER